MESKQQILNRIKLIMNYNQLKTLNENKINLSIPLNENEVILQEDNAFATLLKSLSKSEKIIVSDILKNKNILNKGSQPIKDLKTLDDELRNLNVGSKGVADIRTGLIKDTRTSAALKTKLIDHLTNDPNVLAKYKNKTTQEIKDAFVGKLKYGDKEAEEIANSISRKNGAKSTGFGKPPKVPLGGNNSIVNSQFGPNATIIQNNGGTINFSTTSMSKYQKNLNSSKQAAGIPKGAKQKITKNIQNVTKIKKWNQFTDWAKRNLSVKWLYGLGILGGGYLLYKFLFGDNTNPDIPDWSPCMTDMINYGGNNVSYGKTKTGDLTILVKKSERYPELDKVGGLWFFHNGRVTSADAGRTKRGTWSCASGEMQVAENIILNEDALGNIQITWDDERRKADNKPRTDNKPLYKDCMDFPFSFGCRNEKIKEMQVCLGFESKYQTGNFGPITQKALNGATTIDQDLYNKTVESCKEKITPVDIPKPTDVPSGEQEPKSEIPTPETPNSEVPKPEEKTIEPTKPEESGEQLYNRFLEAGYFRAGKIGNRLVKYKGPDLNQENLDKLNDYLKSNNYAFIKEKDKAGQYGDLEDEKYVWRRIKIK